MKTKQKSYEMDMCNGPLLGKILIFSVPLMLSSILQLLFNAVDIIVVGNFSGQNSLAAVGSTGSAINLIVSLFMGLSVGVNVLVARFFASDQKKDLSETIHTAISISIVAGIVLAFLGFIVAKPLMTLMGAPTEVVDLAALYMRIYFLGMPTSLLYNFGSAILRGFGDTKRPLYYLIIAGILNTVLNLFFVLVLKLDVAGVALATIISEALSATLVLRCLTQSEEAYRLSFSKMGINYEKLMKIIQIGLPAGLQGALFSLSNVLIQSSVNSFGSIAMAGNAAAMNIEGFVYVSMNSIYQASVTFTSQNYGGRQYKRMNRVLAECVLVVFMVGIILGYGAFFCARPLLRIYSSDQAVIAFGVYRMSVICKTYFLCGMMDVICGSMRGMGYSIVPMIVSLLGACGFRILWIATIFQTSHTLTTLYISYPVSWLITVFAHFICFLFIRNLAVRKLEVEYKIG